MELSLDIYKCSCWINMAEKSSGADKASGVTPEKSPRKQPRQFKKCKSATFTLDGMNYVIGKVGSNLTMPQYLFSDVYKGR